MTITVKEILLAVDSGALKRLAGQPIPAMGAWKLRRILRLLEAEFAAAFEADPVFAQSVTLDCEPLPVDLLAGATISASDMELVSALLT